LEAIVWQHNLHGSDEEVSTAFFSKIKGKFTNSIGFVEKNFTLRGGDTPQSFSFEPLAVLRARFTAVDVSNILGLLPNSP